MSRPTAIARLRATVSRRLLALRFPDESIPRVGSNRRRLKQVSVIILVGALHALVVPSASAETLLFQNFDDVAALSGWTLVNNSDPVGQTGWFQGEPSVAFDAQAGAAESYIAANFNNAGFGGAISNWLILPELAFDGNGTLDFYTRSAGSVPDRLEVRFSAGGGADVGGNPTSVGTFSTLLLTINQDLESDAYPDVWTQYSISLLALSGQSGRLAFRYSIDDTSENGDYIGIDTVTVSSSAAPVPEPATLALLSLGIGGLVVRRRQRRTRA